MATSLCSEFNTLKHRELVRTLQEETPNCWAQRLKSLNFQLYHYIDITYNGDFFAEKAYLFYNQLGSEKIKCSCGSKIKFNGFIRGYSPCCKKCAANSDRTNKRKETLLSRYGTSNLYEIPGYIEKRAKTIDNDDWKQQFGNAVRLGLERNNISIPQKFRSEWKIYKLAVKRFTNKQPISSLPGIENRGQGKGKMNIDHIVSIFDGFKNSIPPFIIGSIHNLRMMDAVENSRKMHRSDLSISDLLNKFYLIT